MVPIMARVNWKKSADDHAPEAADRGVDAGDRQADEDRREPVPPERHGEDLGHGQVHPAHDHAVDQDAEVEGAETAQERRGPARVAQFRELDVGEDARTAPQAREEEHREHAAVAALHQIQFPAMPFLRDEAGHGQWRVGRERRGHHRGAGQPPRELSSAEEEISDAAPAALREPEPQ
jgi:hypothetical protein